jgi:N-acetylglucosamine-6-phosphate deacetylase
LAHSDASYEQTCEAIWNGLRLCAHIFNAMPPLHHRNPGPIGAFLAPGNTYVELISDGQHLHPCVMDLLIKAKGKDGIILVTDAVTPAGTDMKRFRILGVELEVVGNTCYLPKGGLAGSALTMNKAVHVIATRTSTDLHTALQMASLNPARLLGIDKRKGSIEVGKDADFFIADDKLNVYTTVVEGRLVFDTN